MNVEPLYGEKLNAQQTAKLLNIKAATLRQWRSKHRGPSFYRVGRCVWYLRDEVLAYVRTMRVDCH